MTAQTRQHFLARLREVRAKAPDIIWDCLGFAGAANITYGAFLIYGPAGWILGGMFLIGLAVLFGPTRKKSEAAE